MSDWAFGDFGFTGTMAGMTKAQAQQFMNFMLSNGDSVKTFHHGDAVGADAQAHELMGELMPWVRRYGYPSNIPGKRSYSSGFYFVEEPQPPLVRNGVILSKVQVLCAAPAQMQEVLRSGTWSTIRHGLKEKLVIIFFPDGSVKQNREFASEEQGSRLI